MTEYLDDYCHLANLENLDYVAQQIEHRPTIFYKSILNYILRHNADKTLYENITLKEKYQLYASDIIYYNTSKKLKNMLPSYNRGLSICLIQHIISKYSSIPYLVLRATIAHAFNLDFYIILIFIKRNIISYKDIENIVTTYEDGDLSGIFIYFPKLMEQIKDYSRFKWSKSLRRRIYKIYPHLIKIPENFYISIMNNKPMCKIDKKIYKYIND